MQVFITFIILAMARCENIHRLIRRAKQANLNPARVEIQGYFGLPAGYSCYGRVFDEPRRIRLQCTKNPDRMLNCACHRSRISTLITCSCSKLHDDAGAPGTSPLPQERPLGT